MNYVKTSTTQLKPIKAGAHLCLKQELLKSPEFPFESDEMLKIEIQDDKLVILRPQWWEMLDWNQVPHAWKNLPPMIRLKITEAGLAPIEF